MLFGEMRQSRVETIASSKALRARSTAEVRIVFPETTI
jgi:hypothetical protein